MSVQRSSRTRKAVVTKIGSAIAALALLGACGAVESQVDDSTDTPTAADSSSPASTRSATETTGPTTAPTTRSTADPAETGSSAGPDRGSTAPPAASTGSALAALETLTVAGRAPKTGYDRGLFAWRGHDFDRNGCDARNDVLRRDLTSLKIKPGTNGCVVDAGVLDDPFTATRIHFTRGSTTSNDVQIDHVVALSDAWQKGAQQWSSQRLKDFGNDPLNLLAVQGRANSQKGDGDAATWLPPNRGFRCEYVARQIAVKVKYSLRVTSAEKDAMRRVLSPCPKQTLPGPGAPTRPKTTAPQPPPPKPTTPKPTTPKPTQTPPAGGGAVRPGADGSCPDSAPIKGNQGRPDWIYHVRGQSPNYHQTKAEECFATTADAERAGYRAPKR